MTVTLYRDDVIKWKDFLRNWPFVRGIHRSPVNSPHKGQWRGALMFSLICVWINDWVNNREAGDLRCYHAQYDVIVILYPYSSGWRSCLRLWGLRSKLASSKWNNSLIIGTCPDDNARRHVLMSPLYKNNFIHINILVPRNVAIKSVIL